MTVTIIYGLVCNIITVTLYLDLPAHMQTLMRGYFVYFMSSYISYHTKKQEGAVNLVV